MNLSRKTLLILAGAAFALMLVAHAPAALLYAAFKSKDARSQAYGLQGAWMEGALSGISLNGRLVAQDIRWKLRPLQLLLGRAAVQFAGGGQIATLEGSAAISLLSKRLTNFRFAGGIKNLAMAAGYAYVPVDGQAGGMLEKLVFTKAGLDTVEGHLSLTGLLWTLARDPVLLGDFHAKLSTQPDAITAVIESPSGPLQAKGTAKLLPDQRYEVDLLLKPRPGASDLLLNYIRTLGAPDAQGNYHLQQKGRLP